jgi:hypothetical protein
MYGDEDMRRRGDTGSKPDREEGKREHGIGDNEPGGKYTGNYMREVLIGKSLRSLSNGWCGKETESISGIRQYEGASQ